MPALMQRSFYALALFLALASLARADEEVVTGNRRVTKVLEQVYQIKTATEAGAPKAAYGSCFVVGPEGLLATNYHVVAFALQEPEKYNLYLIDGDQTIPAEVVAFDVVNDLALVRVAKTFPKAVRFATTLPEAGAKIYSMGWPEDLNKSVIEGNYNGMMTSGPYEKVQMSIPLNPGMSGGPTLNEAGDVIGVNVSIRLDSQSLAFAVPANTLKALLAKAPASFSRTSDGPAFDEEVRSQLEHVQEVLTTRLLKASTDTISIGGWRASKPARMIKCWRDEENGTRDVTTATTETCYLPASAPVRRDVDTATFRIKYQAIENNKLNAWQFTTHLNEATNGFGFFLADYIEKFTTKLKCGEMDLVNAHKVPMRAHYCLNAYVHYAEIYNFELEAVTLPKEQSGFLVAMSFLGFSSRNITDVTRALLNSIKPETP